MKAGEHAAKILKLSELILRLLAARKYAEIIPLLDQINDHAYDIQTEK